MRSPGITPQRWFQDLPELPSELPVPEFAIFTGEVNGLTNLVVRVDDTTLRMVARRAGVYWQFDLVSGEFVQTPSDASEWAAQVIEMSGRSLQPMSVYKASEVTMSMVGYKLSPAE